jgi:hypothetical protein
MRVELVASDLNRILTVPQSYAPISDRQFYLLNFIENLDIKRGAFRISIERSDSSGNDCIEAISRGSQGLFFSKAEIAYQQLPEIPTGNSSLVCEIRRCKKTPDNSGLVTLESWHYLQQSFDETGAERYEICREVGGHLSEREFWEAYVRSSFDREETGRYALKQRGKKEEVFIKEYHQTDLGLRWTFQEGTLKLQSIKGWAKQC